MPLAFYANDDIRNTSDYSDDGGDGKGTGSTAMRRLRKAVITRFGAQTIDRLKLYVAVPVLKKIEEGQPLEYLSEMRQVKLYYGRCIKLSCIRILHRCCMRVQLPTSRN
jgi:hypothetical protein